MRAQDEGGGLIPSALCSYSRFVRKIERAAGAFLLVPNSQEKILHSSTSKATCKGRMCHTACGTDENEQK